MIKKRLRNYAMWASISAKLLLMVQLIAMLLGYEIPSDVMNSLQIIIVDCVLGTLALLGIVSNPTKPDSKGYNL